MSTAAALTFDECDRALLMLGATVGRAPASDRLKILRGEAIKLRPYIDEGMLHPATVSEEIWGVAERYHLLGEVGGDEEREIRDIEHQATAPPGLRNPEEPPPVDSFDSFGLSGEAAPETGTQSEPVKSLPAVVAITPASWRGSEPFKQEWLASARIPCGDLTILTGNGGSGKTEIIMQLLIYLAAALGDWLGCTIEAGAALFLSCEEPEHNIRDRVERICKHRDIDPHGLTDLHLVFPELDATWLAHVGRDGRLIRAPLLDWLDDWIRRHRPRLVVIDSIAAVFDGDAIARRQVRGFLAMLRKIAREYGVAIVLLDHPSVRGMADGTGTANSVDWRNSVRSMLRLSDPDKDDLDQRVLTVTKSNYGRTGEKITLRWNGLTFSTEAAEGVSPYRAAADRDVDDLFLRLLDKRNAQGRPVRPSTGRGSAPAEMADDPDANGVRVPAFRAAMERLFTAGKIKTVETGSPAKRRKHIERA